MTRTTPARPSGSPAEKPQPREVDCYRCAARTPQNAVGTVLVKTSAGDPARHHTLCRACLNRLGWFLAGPLAPAAGERQFKGY